MLLKRRLKTNTQQVRMSQKNPIKRSSKLQRLTKDTAQGVVSVYATQSALVSEKSIISAYTDLKRATKGVGIVWLKPLKVKTTTTKSGKRMGKGKGITVTYNRALPIKAGQMVFEIGYVTQLSGRSLALTSLLRPCCNKLSFNVRFETRPGISIFLTSDVPLTVSNYK